jgi:hypothetical protein
LVVHPPPTLDGFTVAERLRETPGLEPILLATPPVDRKSSRHFHTTACFGMRGQVCTDCVVGRELTSTEAWKTDERRLGVLQKRKRPNEWRSVEEALDRCMWMDTAWDSHLCQWSMNRFSMYKTLVQLKYFGWSCDFEASQLDQTCVQTYEDAWRDLDQQCGGAFSGPSQSCANAEPGKSYVLPGKVFLYVGDDCPTECFREWNFRGVHLRVAKGRGPQEGDAWDWRNLSGVPSHEDVPWPMTSSGAVQLWPEGEVKEPLFDIVILDLTPKRSSVVPGLLSFFLELLRMGGVVVVKLASLPKCKALTPLWHLVRIFGCGSVRLRKPGVGPEAHRSSFYAICRDFPGAGIPPMHDLDQVSYVLLMSTSRDVEVGGRTDLPPMPTCIPTPTVVLVRHFCAFMEALSRDAKPIWNKQYLALHSSLIAIAANPRPWDERSSLLGKEGGRSRRRAEDTKGGFKKSRSQRVPRSYGNGVSTWFMRPGIQQTLTVLIVILWIAANFYYF